MTSLYLVRHAAHVLQDQVLVGRLPGIELSEVGRTFDRNDVRLVARLKRCDVRRVDELLWHGTRLW
jgi:hypothetical protein